MGGEIVLEEAVERDGPAASGALVGRRRGVCVAVPIRLAQAGEKGARRGKAREVVGGGSGKSPFSLS